MSNDIINISSKGLFLRLFEQEELNLINHWEDQPDKLLRVMARQIVLEDGTIIQLTAEDERNYI